MSGAQIVAVGDEIVIREGSTLWRSESGQGVIDFTADQLANRTLPFARKTSAPARRVPEREAEDWYDLACELERNAPRQAQDAYQSALELDPSHAGARVNLGRLLHDPVAAFNLGVALEDLGRVTEAIAAYELAIAADPAAADAHFNLAGLYEKEGKAAEAIRHFKAYRKLTQGR